VAKKSDKVEVNDEPGAQEIETNSALKVVRVNPPKDGGEVTDDWHNEQAQALNDYRVSGHPGIYLDQSRDQEPDIAPELGVAPHPELANPKPPELAGARGIGEPSDSPLAQPLEEREAAAPEDGDGADKAALAAEKALVAGAGSPAVAPGPAQPVVVVADNSEENAKAAKEAEKASDSK
jgi:hypothetical protein